MADETTNIQFKVRNRELKDRRDALGAKLDLNNEELLEKMLQSLEDDMATSIHPEHSAAMEALKSLTGNINDIVVGIIATTDATIAKTKEDAAQRVDAAEARANETALRLTAAKDRIAELETAEKENVQLRADADADAKRIDKLNEKLSESSSALAEATKEASRARKEAEDAISESQRAKTLLKRSESEVTEMEQTIKDLSAKSESVRAILEEKLNHANEIADVNARSAAEASGREEEAKKRVSQLESEVKDLNKQILDASKSLAEIDILRRRVETLENTIKDYEGALAAKDEEILSLKTAFKSEAAVD